MNFVMKVCKSCAAVWAIGMLAAVCHASEECSLVVTVLDPAGEVVADARVSLIEKRQSAFVDANGRVTFKDLSAGSYHVEAVSRQFGAIVNEVTLTEGALARLEWIEAVLAD